MIKFELKSREKKLLDDFPSVHGGLAIDVTSHLIRAVGACYTSRTSKNLQFKMEEKRLLGGTYLDDQALRQPRRRQPLSTRLILVIAGIVTCLALLHFHWRPHTIFRHSQRPTHYHTYEGEHIKWEECGDLKGRPLECSSIDVPMDQFDAENSGNKTFSIPLIRMRGKNATQNILLNPGGPGGSGINFLYRKGEELNTILGEGLHLLTFDPRGINGSSPLASCYPDNETRRDLSNTLDSTNPDNSVQLYAWTSNFVQACADTMGEHGKYINTPQTAADMNSILDAVGQEDMVYWGFSYGTLLGQTYAGLFPNRSKRVIIDGVVNQFDWFEGLVDEEDMADTENVLHGFFDECIKAGSENCTLASLASSKEELEETVLSFLSKFKEEPLSVYVNNTVYGVLDYSKLLLKGIFPTLYKPANWYDLADRLTKLIQGNATEAFLAYGRDDPWNMIGDANRFVTLNDGLSGPKYWVQGRQALLEEILPLQNLSLFGTEAWDTLYSKQQWSIPRTHTYKPRKGVQTAHPLLILSTTYDPVCPLISARSANEAFVGSQIVEVQGYGHCSLAIGSTCLAKRVREFLYEGKVLNATPSAKWTSPTSSSRRKTAKLWLKNTLTIRRSNAFILHSCN